MIAPTAFGFNDQTAQDNSFMHASREGGSTDAGSDVTQHVLREFSGLYRELTEVIFAICPHLSLPCFCIELTPIWHQAFQDAASGDIAADSLAWLLIVMH